MKTFFPLAAVLAALTFFSAGQANAVDAAKGEYGILPARTTGTLVFLPAANSMLRAEYPVLLGEGFQILPGGSLSLGTFSGLTSGNTPDGGSITIIGFFSDDASRPGLTYQWTGDDRARPPGVALVPEPGTGLLLAAGLALLAARRRRNQHGGD